MDVFTIIAEQPEKFLQPQSSLHDSALKLAKEYLDPLATQITNAQTRRLHEDRKSRKRKRGARNMGDEGEGEGDVLRMKQIYTEGFDFHQIWHQARQVLFAANNEVYRQLPSDPADVEGEDHMDLSTSELDDEEYNGSDGESLGKEGVDWTYDNDEDISEVDEDGHGALVDDVSDEEPPPEMEEDDSVSNSLNGYDDPEEQQDLGEEFVKDPNGLNDGFFSIDNFNKRTQFLEQQDARGEPDDGAASDEEDIDWTTDPLLQTFAPSGSSKHAQRDAIDENEDESEEDGPTFSNADLNGLDSDEDMDDAAGLEPSAMGGAGDDFSNTNNILYSDFFAPPAKNVPKSKKQGKRSGRFQERAATMKQSLAREYDDDENLDEQDGELERAMAGVQRDLFDDESEEELENEDETSEIPPGQRSLSSHERKQLALRTEIRRLEAENMAEKPWAMTGETVAPTRPQNALLEEDLDFERAGKPVPIITTETNESIEELIKRRILAKEFDEVRRRRPDELLKGNGKDLRRGRLEEVSDSKSKKSLAEEYEEDYLRENDPNFVDTRSEAIKKQHREIEEQWVQVSAQLDALSNWHYKPRPVASSLDVRVDVPTVALEDARPAAGEDVAGASAIAPQELYKIGADGKRANEVISKGGTVAGREEETQDQRKRRRRRQKERRRKLEGNKAITDVPDKNQPEDAKAKRTRKSEVVGQLKKGGVKIIGKRGELQDVEGNSIKNNGAQPGVGNFKL